MSLVTLSLPDGIFRGATEYASKGHWYDANLVRFRNGVKLPIGGWRERSAETVSGVPRACHAWADSTLRGWIGAGTHSGLYVQSRGGTVTDITPYGFVAGRANATQGGGWGTGTWGRGTWGTRRRDVKGILPANTWSLANWGENLVGIFDTGTKPVEWIPGVTAAPSPDTGTAQAGGATSITLSAGSSAVNDAYVNYWIVITGGTGVSGETRLITDYVGASKVATVDRAWTTNPDATTTYEIRLSGAITNAPTGVGLCVTDERFLMVIGAVYDDPAIGGGPLRVAWSDRENNKDWDAASTTNEAGFFDLTSDSELMTVVKVRGGVLILSRTDAFFGEYKGTQFVYGFERVGSNCGVVSRKAVTVINGVAYWRGVNGFYSFDGYVQPVKCDVWEYVRTSSNQTQASKNWCMGNASNDEVWFFDCEGTSSEITRYFYTNIRDNHWSVGQLSRTAGADVGVFRDPLMLSSTGTIYEHEVGLNYDGAIPYLESGPLELGNGDNSLTVTQFIPDERTEGQSTVTLKGKFWPNLAEFSSGPFSAASPASVMFNARQVKVRFNGVSGQDFRVGDFRFEVKQRGKR